MVGPSEKFLVRVSSGVASATSIVDRTVGGGKVDSKCDDMNDECTVIFDIHWWLSLTAHQLDVVRTIATVIGGAFVPLLGLLLGWGIKVLRATRRAAEAGERQTAHEERIDGKLRTVPVVEYARHAAHAGDRAVIAGEATRLETSELAVLVRGSGRRRLPTSEVPRPQERHE